MSEPKKVHVPIPGNAFHRIAQVKRALHHCKEDSGVGMLHPAGSMSSAIDNLRTK